MPVIQLEILSGNWASLVAQTVKNLPAKKEAQIQSLVWEDSLEKGMVIHSSILVWRIPWMVEPGRLQSMGPKESDMTEGLTLRFMHIGQHLLISFTLPTPGNQLCLNLGF